MATATEYPGARWHKSSRSTGNGQCVEVAENLADFVRVRDTKDNGRGPVLHIPHAQWAGFLDLVKAGEFNLP